MPMNERMCERGESMEAEPQRMTQLKDEIQLLCKAYIQERPTVLRAHGVMTALLYSTSVFKGMFDAQGIKTVDDELRYLLDRTEAISRQSTEQSLNRKEVEDGTSC